MSSELALKIYEQAKDRLQEYIDQAPPSQDDRLEPSTGEREHEIERLKHAVELARQAYVRTQTEPVEGRDPSAPA